MYSCVEWETVGAREDRAAFWALADKQKWTRASRAIPTRVPPYHLFIASTPPMISDSSVVIWDWRARLYRIVRDLIILSAFSVADFIETMRATFSLVTASRNAW